MSTIWHLPKVTFTSLSSIQETRPVALLTSEAAWNSVGHLLNLPLVVQAEPSHTDSELMTFLAENLPSQAEVVYVVGTGAPITAGKIVASANKLPLVFVPTAIDTDMIFEAHATLSAEGLLTIKETGPANEVFIDWEVLQAAPVHERAVAIVDLIAIVTAILDWRYAAQQNKNPENQKFSVWASGIAANLAAQAIKSARAIGDGDIESMRLLIDMLMVSVQLASQLGHDRLQEGTEHYLAFSLENQKVAVNHAEAVGTGILWAAALHGQDPAPLREALEAAGVRLNQIRAADIQLAINDLPTFCVANNLPFSRAHDLDPFADYVKQALEKAGLSSTEGGWQVSAPPAEEGSFSHGEAGVTGIEGGKG